MNYDWMQLLKKAYEKDDGSFSNHKTGVTIKLFPFTTKYTDKQSDEDLTSFMGILGESLRLRIAKVYDKKFKSDSNLSFKEKLKNHIISGALSKVETNENERLKDILLKVFFEEDFSLVKFNKGILPYLHFINDKSQLREISKFIYDLFLSNPELTLSFEPKDYQSNILYKLVFQSLPQLVESNKSSGIDYVIFNKEIVKLFYHDLETLQSNENDFLEHIQDLIKYYYFFYLGQLAMSLNRFGESTLKVDPIYFTLDWEVLSESRPACARGWNRIEPSFSNLFAHSVTLEFLNYLPFENKQQMNYNNISENFEKYPISKQNELLSNIETISTYYQTQISSLRDAFRAGESWDKCETELKAKLENRTLTEIQKSMYSLYYKVNYQFINSGRNPRYNDYSKWFLQFCKLNFTKFRGRFGYTTTLNQEMLLFLTKLCIGSNDKLRVKHLWIELERRGLKFDESSKMEIIKLFEKINLLEKKSDSGDAQYVKSII